MTFHPTEDYALVAHILTRSRTWSFITNDAAPAIDEFRVEPGHYSPILCTDDAGMLAGLFILVPTEERTAEVHFAFLPGRMWEMAEAGKEFVEWIWEGPELDVLIGPCPTYNPLALRTARACGFLPFALERGTSTKNGEPFGLIVCKIERPTSTRLNADPLLD